MQPNQVIDAIENGAATNDEIAEFLGLDFRHVGRELKEMAEDASNPLVREKDGRSFVYSVDEETVADDPNGGDVAATNGEDAKLTGDGRMAALRDYDWDERVPVDVPEYIPNNGEWDEINALVDAREITGMAHANLGGPTGCGKTHLARRLAFERDFPMFTIQGKYSMNESKLLGSPTIAPDGTTVWTDGILTKAVMASAERPVVLLLDEVNRSRPEAKSVLLAALDDRCEVTLDGERGGEKIQGKSENLIVISTMNEGREHHVQEMDSAEKRRLGPKFNVTYLGIDNPSREAALVADRTELNETVAEMMVKTANEVRELADDPESSVRSGVPTATLIDWADTAYAYNASGIDNPVVKAGESAVTRMFYGGKPGASKVSQIIQNHLAGCPVDEEDATEFRDGERTVYACDDCGWNATSDDDLPECATDWNECPDCGAKPVDVMTRSF